MGICPDRCETVPTVSTNTSDIAGLQAHEHEDLPAQQMLSWFPPAQPSLASSRCCAASARPGARGMPPPAQCAHVVLLVAWPHPFLSTSPSCLPVQRLAMHAVIHRIPTQRLSLYRALLRCWSQSGFLSGKLKRDIRANQFTEHIIHSWVYLQHNLTNLIMKLRNKN